MTNLLAFSQLLSTSTIQGFLKRYITGLIWGANVYGGLCKLICCNTVESGISKPFWSQKNSLLPTSLLLIR